MLRLVGLGSGPQSKGYPEKGRRTQRKRETVKETEREEREMLVGKSGGLCPLILVTTAAKFRHGRQNT